MLLVERLGWKEWMRWVWPLVLLVIVWGRFRHLHLHIIRTRVEDRWELDLFPEK